MTRPTLHDIAPRRPLTLAELTRIRAEVEAAWEIVRRKPPGRPRSPADAPERLRERRRRTRLARLERLARWQASQ